MEGKQDHLSGKQLWDYMEQYLYLFRLKEEDILVSAIRNGVRMLTLTDYFAYASAAGEDGKYIDLVAGPIPAITPNSSSELVKGEAAQNQREDQAPSVEKPTCITECDQTTAPTGWGSIHDLTPPKPQERAPRSFQGNIDLEPIRFGTSIGGIAGEAVSHHPGRFGARVNVTLEIDVEVADGIPEVKIRIVSENCNTLKFNNH